MFVDASAIVAIVTGEADGDALADALDRAAAPLSSPIAYFEAVLGVIRKFDAEIGVAEQIIQEFLAAARTTMVAIEPADASAAIGAFARFGKGRGHPAKLNLGDCFAYAMAKNRGLSLLFKGDGFPETDILPALR